MGRGLLAPGFRFHPTDVELVRYYLRRKVMGKKLCFDVIAEIDIYKFNPWELAAQSRLRMGDLKWYFFCPREKKYAGGARMKRATESGYWKMTGRDRSVSYKDEVAGMIKTLVFHTGKAPKGERTDWVMYEYRLEEKGLAGSGIVQDAYVLCVIFKKDGPGPKNGAQYGAPFNEDDWNDDGDDDEENTDAPGEISLGGTSFILPTNQLRSIPTSLNVPDSVCNTSSQSCPASACLAPDPSCNSDVSKEYPQVAIVGGVNSCRASSSGIGCQSAVLPVEPGYCNVTTSVPCASKTLQSAHGPLLLVSGADATRSNAYGPSQVASVAVGPFVEASQLKLDHDDEIVSMLASFMDENDKTEVFDDCKPSDADPSNIYNDLEDLDMGRLGDNGQFLELMDLEGPLFRC